MAKENIRKIGKKMQQSKAKKWVKRYQKENPDAAVKGWLFGDDVIEALINNKGCEGIWFFKGINDDGEEKLVMFPADEDGNILQRKLRSLGAAAANLKNGDDDDDNAADDSRNCPPFCPNM